MAVQAMSNRQMYPSIGSFHPAHASSPGAVQSPHLDQHGRTMYGQGFPLPPHLYGYPQYTLPQQQSYSPQGPLPQAYPSVSSAGPGMMLSSQQAPSMIHQQSNHSQSPMVNNQGPRLKVEPSPIQRTMSLNMAHANMSAQGGGMTAAQPPASTSNPNAAPGPIPATTPLVVRQDGNGVQWIAFEYSRDRVKMEYTIRCDVESVNVEELEPDFKSANCVYPRACTNKGDYKGNRLHYESECNGVGWALAELNPVLREKRGLIQRAVDSWRNSNQDPRLRSRRVRRMAKLSTRKAQNHMVQTPTSSHLHGPGQSMSTQGAHNMSVGAVRPMSVAAGQLHHHHSNMDGIDVNGGNDVSAGDQYSSSLPRPQRPRASSSSSFISPAESRHAGAVIPAYPHWAQASRSSMPSLQDGFDRMPSSAVKEEDDEKKQAVHASDLQDGKRRKFILVDDSQRGTRVRVRVSLDDVKMDDMPDSHLRNNSVFPRSYYARQMRAHAGASALPSAWDDDVASESEDAGPVRVRGRALVSVAVADGGLVDLAVPRLRRSRRAKECALNELGYRISWSQAKTFNGRVLFMQRSLDAYRNKMRRSTGPEEGLFEYAETRAGKRKWLHRRRRSVGEGSP